MPKERKPKKFETVKVCVKCHKTMSGKMRHCPYCGGTLIEKVVHHRMPDGKEVPV